MTKEQSLRDEYLEWIRNKQIDGAVCKETEDGIRFETDFAIAEVNFYEFEIMVAELRRIEDEDALEYMLLGIMILCIRFLEESSIKQP